MESQYSYEPIGYRKIDHYVRLLRLVHTRYRHSNSYIEWLYFGNPLGEVLGFDAIFQKQVVAHYACLPINIGGEQNQCLVSVNTVTHPQHQGKGLFKHLAELTFDLAGRMKFSHVVGVANERSFDGFTRKLGFSSIGKLNLRFGPILRSSVGARVFSDAEINWILEHPERRQSVEGVNEGIFHHSTTLPSWPIRLQTLFFSPEISRQVSQTRPVFTIDWNSVPTASLRLPTFLKPSPLHLITKSLEGDDNISLSSWTYLDFDLI